MGAKMNGRFGYFMVFVMLFAQPLGGCSSGGSSPAPASTSTPAPVSQPAPVVPQATAIPAVAMLANFQAANTTATYRLTAATEIVDTTGLREVMNYDGPTTVTITTDAGGKFSKASFNLANAAPDITLADPAQVAQVTSVLMQTYYAPDPPDGVGLALSKIAGAQTLSSSAYGLWTTSYEIDPHGHGAGRGYSLAFGSLTPANAVPAGGSATLNGTTIGVGGGNDALYALHGNAQIVANFSNQSVVTNLTNLSIQNTSTKAASALPDLTGTGTISGNGYSGAIAGTGLIGSITGSFYGSAAQETAGVWKAAGGGNIWMGSFGAK